MEEIILASGSPRRRELLAQIGIPFKVMKSEAPEVITKTQPEQIVRELALQKARWVYERLALEDEEKLVLGADTIVVSEGKILGKPADREDARRMLTALQGKTHSVYTGVALLRKGPGRADALTCRTFCRETRVTVHAMSEAEIEAYLDTGDPFDKAGSYGIQGPFAAFVDKIEGDYPNVVGLPVSALWQELKDFCADTCSADDR